MTQLPVNFYSTAEATGAFESSWKVESGSNLARCDVPVEFGGAGSGFSPEDLYLQALINCFIGTFKVIAKGSKLNFANLSVLGSLVVDKGSDGKTCMKSCFLKIEITDCDRPDRVEMIAAKTFRDGFILNSVKTEISYELVLLSPAAGPI